MNKLEAIEIQGHKLDIYGTKEDPMFLAVEVAKLIDYSIGHTSHMLANIDDCEKKLVMMSTRTTNATARGSATQKWFLTEFGFYEVMMQSRKPMARKFKQMVKLKLRDMRRREEITFEEMFMEEDPLVAEWETWCRDRSNNGECEMDLADWLVEFKGYTPDML